MNHVSQNPSPSNIKSIDLSGPSNRKPRSRKLTTETQPTSLPPVSFAPGDEGMKVLTAQMKEQFDLEFSAPVLSKPQFRRTTLDQLRSGEYNLNDVDIGVGDNTQKSTCLYVRTATMIPISEARAEGGVYYAGQISTLNWRGFEGFARGAWTMLATALKVTRDKIGFTHGVLVVNRQFCLAAEFELGPELVAALSSKKVRDRIETCNSLLGDVDLHSDYELAKKYVGADNGDLIEAARAARKEITTRNLACDCLIESALWKQPIVVSKDLAAKKPATPKDDERHEQGELTGYCIARRLLHFQIEKNNTLVDISFDEEKYFDEIIKISGKVRPLVELRWEDSLDDKGVMTRVLKEEIQILRWPCSLC